MCHVNNPFRKFSVQNLISDKINLWVKDEITKDIRKYLVINDKKITTYHKMCLYKNRMS